MNIAYSVEEVNRLGLIRSKLITQCPWHAMAETLMKTHYPVGFPPGVRVRDGEIALDFTGNSTFGRVATLEIDLKFFWEGSQVRGLTVKTIPADLGKDIGYTSETSPIYLGHEYVLGVSQMMKKIFKYCDGDLIAAYMLVQCASKDPYHQFFRSRLWRRGLSF